MEKNDIHHLIFQLFCPTFYSSDDEAAVLFWSTSAWRAELSIYIYPITNVGRQGAPKREKKKKKRKVDKEGLMNIALRGHQGMFALPSIHNTKQGQERERLVCTWAEFSRATVAHYHNNPTSSRAYDFDQHHLLAQVLPSYDFEKED